jgi:arsenate reductase (thioredoxin)
MMSTQPFNVLFLCTGNSARSILAEAILNSIGRGRFMAYSAGSHAVGQVNPFAIEMLRQHRFATDHLRSKSWSEFATQEAPPLDFVFTVCDNAAGETCPVWPGQPMTAHWGIRDPAAVAGTEDEIRRAFFDAYQQLHRRISMFVSLPIGKLDRLSLLSQLKEIGSN